jgi:hypothetical protein
MKSRFSELMEESSKTKDSCSCVENGVLIECFGLIGPDAPSAHAAGRFAFPPLFQGLVTWMPVLLQNWTQMLSERAERLTVLT